MLFGPLRPHYFIPAVVVCLAFLVPRTALADDTTRSPALTATGIGSIDRAAPVIGFDRAAAATELVTQALSMLGVRYRFGGSSPDSGLDCSGLVRYVYAETIGRVLPRRAAEMSREGEPVELEELEPGDLVFFNTLRRAFSHVGIYIGDGQFVHAPRRGQSVRVESLDSRYWTRRYNGARRLLAVD